MIHVSIYFFSIVVLYRYIRYFLRSSSRGKLLFNAYFSPTKIFVCLLNFLLYIFYVVAFYLLKFCNVGFSFIDIFLPFTWVLLTFLPDQIYENGIKTPYEFMPWHEITILKRPKENILILCITQNGIQRKIYLYLKNSLDCDSCIQMLTLCKK